MKRISIGVIIVAFASVAAHAHVPTYNTFQLQARSNLCANEAQGFNLPCSVFFNSSTPAINDHAKVVIKLDVIGSSGKQGIWYGGNGTGSIVYQSPVDASVSDPTLNNAGYAVFPQTLSSQNGLYYYNSQTQMSGLRSTLPFGTTAWGSPMVNNVGQIGFRSTFSGSGQAFYSLEGASTLALHAAEVGLDAQSPYSFLFSPAFNNNRQIAAHVRRGGPGQTGNSQPDEIRLFNMDGSSILIASDADAQPGSPYTGFDSSRPAVTNDGRVAFVANLAAGGRGIFLGNGSTTTTIVTTTGTPGLSAIDFFPPAVNDHGLVAFRGTDASGRSAVFVSDGVTLRRVIGKFDPIPTDLGMGQIAQHDSSVVFGGSVGINARGDVTFNCALTPVRNTQIEWGSGLYVALADVNAADINHDGHVNVIDLLAVINAWGPCPALPAPCPADVAPAGVGDGSVNVSDLLLVINNWG